MNKGTDRMSETSFQGKGSIFEELKKFKIPLNIIILLLSENATNSAISERIFSIGNQPGLEIRKFSDRSNSSLTDPQIFNNT